MNFYPFHIGDYSAHTRNLSLIEDIAYRRMLDAYYLAEAPLAGTVDEIAREIGMRDHLTEVEYVLNKFFEPIDGGWKHERCDAEIAKYASIVAKRSKAGKASAQQKLNTCSTHVDQVATHVEVPSTHVQQTKNQEPLTKKPPPTPLAGGGFEEFWRAYPKRKHRGQAEKAWSKLRPDDAMLKAILLAVEAARQSGDWQRDNGQFIPYPATWINAKGWLDEPPQPATPAKGEWWHRAGFGSESSARRAGCVPEGVTA